MVDDDGQEAVAPLVGDLVDADAHETVKGVGHRPGVGHHPGDDRPNRPPGHPHQLDDRRLGGMRGKPGDLVVEGPGVAGPVAGPGDLHHGRAVGGAGHPGSVRLQEAAQLAHVERPPAAPSLAPVIPGGSDPAPPATLPGPFPGPGQHHDSLSVLVEQDAFEDRSHEPQDALPYGDRPSPAVGKQRADSGALNAHSP